MLRGDFKNIAMVQTGSATDNEDNTLQVDEFRCERNLQLGPRHRAIEVEIPNFLIVVVVEKWPEESIMPAQHTGIFCSNKIVWTFIIGNETNDELTSERLFE